MEGKIRHTGLRTNLVRMKCMVDECLQKNSLVCLLVSLIEDMVCVVFSSRFTPVEMYANSRSLGSGEAKLESCDLSSRACEK
jgi:hypothetical protein